MVRMKVGGQDPLDRSSRQKATQKILPDLLGRTVAQAGIDQRPAIAVVDHPQIDMVQGKRELQPQPEDVVHHLRRLADFRHLYRKSLDHSHMSSSDRSRPVFQRRYTNGDQR